MINNNARLNKQKVNCGDDLCSHDKETWQGQHNSAYIKSLNKSLNQDNISILFNIQDDLQRPQNPLCFIQHLIPRVISQMWEKLLQISKILNEIAYWSEMSLWYISLNYFPTSLTNLSHVSRKKQLPRKNDIILWRP